MIRLKTKEDIKLLTESGRRLAAIIKTLSVQVAPGVMTGELDDLARVLIKKSGGQPAFLNYRPTGSRLAYPAALCVSINNEIVHGLPGRRILKEGDIVSLDLGLNYAGRFTDMAVTLAVGKVSHEKKRLIQITKAALTAGIKAAVAGRHIGDIGWAIKNFVDQNGFNVVDELSGHGVGFAPHEDPLVPNFGQPGRGEKLMPGLVIAIEPMVTSGSDQISLLADGFTFITKDGSMSAHFEHTVLITSGRAKILTA